MNLHRPDSARPDIDAHTVALLWQYMVYADRQEIDAAATVPEEAYFRGGGISLGSVHKLMVHCYDAQRVWLERLRGQPAPDFTDPDSVARDALTEMWRQSQQRLLEFAAEQTPDSLRQVQRFRTRKGEPYEMARGPLMLHVADHATYHRGQLNSMIRLAGGAPSAVMVYTWALQEGFGRSGWSEPAPPPPPVGP